MNESPLISVIIPCYNGAKFLSDAIQSLIAQTYLHWEAIVVNDGSTDNSLDLIREYQARDARIVLVDKANGGLSSARNAGLKVARGEFIALLDCDDAFLKERLQSQVEYLQKKPELDLVYGDYIVADENLSPKHVVASRPPQVPFWSALAYRNWFAVITPLIRRRLVEAVGEFDESLRSSEDWDYWIRCALRGRFGYLPEPVALYRTHGNQLHNNLKRMRESGLYVLKKHYRVDPVIYRDAVAVFEYSHGRQAWFRGQYVRGGWLLLRALVFAGSYRKLEALRMKFPYE